MASNNDGGKSQSLQPIHHHHCGGHHHRHHRHFYYVSPHCPLHRPILLPHNHSPSCSFSTSNSYPSPQNPNPVASVPPDPQLIHLPTHTDQIFNDTHVVEDEIEKLEDEEEGDPIFVLTDEWRDFFAKSEAKRRLAKKQAKKGKK